MLLIPRQFECSYIVEFVKGELLIQAPPFEKPKYIESIFIDGNSLCLKIQHFFVLFYVALCIQPFEFEKIQVLSFLCIKIVFTQALALEQFQLVQSVVINHFSVFLAIKQTFKFVATC